MKEFIEYNMHILILHTLPVICLILIGTVLAIFIIKKLPDTPHKTYNERMGEIGENSIENTLSNIDGYFFILRNLIVPNHDRTAEIDLLLLHEKGIYVFESKNFGGWIYGNKNAMYWLQSFKKKKNKFYNPIRQNETHINALMNLMRLKPENKPTSYIVFGNKATLRKIPPKTEEYTVCQQYNLLSVMNEDLNNKEIKYDHETLTIYYNFLNQYTTLI